MLAMLVKVGEPDVSVAVVVYGWLATTKPHCPSARVTLPAATVFDVGGRPGMTRAQEEDHARTPVVAFQVHCPPSIIRMLLGRMPVNVPSATPSWAAWSSHWIHWSVMYSNQFMCSASGGWAPTHPASARDDAGWAILSGSPSEHQSRYCEGFVVILLSCYMLVANLPTTPPITDTGAMLPNPPTHAWGPAMAKAGDDATPRNASCTPPARDRRKTPRIRENSAGESAGSMST